MKKQHNNLLTAKKRILKQTLYVPSYAPNQSELLKESINSAFEDSEELTTEIAIKIYNSLMEIVKQTRPLYNNARCSIYHQFEPRWSCFADQLDTIYKEIELKLPKSCYNPLYEKPFERSDIQLSDKERILKQAQDSPFYFSSQSVLLTESINSAFENDEELTTEIAIKIYNSLVDILTQIRLQEGSYPPRPGFFSPHQSFKFWPEKIYEELKVKLPESYHNPLNDESSESVAKLSI